MKKPKNHTYNNHEAAYAIVGRKPPKKHLKTATSYEQLSVVNNSNSIPETTAKELLCSTQEESANKSELIELANENQDDIKQDFAESEILEQNNFNTLNIENIALATPPIITPDDTKKHNEEFGCLPSNYYPYFNPDGSFCFFTVRWPHGKDGVGTKKETRPYTFNFETNKWFSKIKVKPRPLYNLFELMTSSKDTILVVEGEKACEAAKILFPEYVVITSSGGANGTNATDWSYTKDKEVIISPDLDTAGKTYSSRVKNLCENAGAISVKKMFTEKLGRFVISNGMIFERQGEVPPKYDLADALADGWTAELINDAVNNKKLFTLFGVEELKIIVKDNRVFEEEEATQHPNYKLTKNEVLYLLEYKEDGEIHQRWTPLCGYLKVICQIRDTESNNWGLLLEIVDKDLIKKQITLSSQQQSNDKTILEILLNKGLRIPRLKKFYKSILTCELLSDYINIANPKTRAIGINKIGWHGNTYILPFVHDKKNSYTIKNGQNINPNNEEFILQVSGELRKLELKGTLESWQNDVGKYCEDNDFLIHACSTALTSMMLSKHDEEGFCLHLAGNSSAGKSTVLYVAGSIFGIGKPNSFRSTENGLENTCVDANDCLLTLDELKLMTCDAFDQSIYMIGNGVGKVRAKKDGSVQKAVEFTTLAITAGEMGMATKLAEKNKTPTAGQSVRFLELNADAGMGMGVFQNIHGFANTALFAAHLMRASLDNCGVVADEYMKLYTAEFELITERIIIIKNEWLKNFVPQNADGQVHRVARKFALKAATGEIAIAAKILPFKQGNSIRASKNMFANWLAGRGGTGSFELQTIKKRLISFLQEERNTKLLSSKDETYDKNIKIAGYVDYDSFGMINEFWLYPEFFNREIIQSPNSNFFYKELIRDGFIMPDKDQNSQRRNLPKLGRTRVVVIPASVLNDDEVGNE